MKREERQMEQLCFDWNEWGRESEPEIVLTPETEEELVNLMGRLFIAILKEKGIVDPPKIEDVPRSVESAPRRGGEGQSFQAGEKERSKKYWKTLI
jgi:hypothetical protein